MNQQTERQQDDVTIDRTSVYVSSVAAVTALFFFGVGLPCWYAFDLGWGVGLGAMCAFWGGPGFGVMAAGARLSMHEERLHDERVASAAGAENAPAVIAGGLVMAAA